jgi:hypothetical protein
LPLAVPAGWGGGAGARDPRSSWPWFWWSVSLTGAPLVCCARWSALPLLATRVVSPAVFLDVQNSCCSTASTCVGGQRCSVGPAVACGPAAARSSRLRRLLLPAAPPAACRLLRSPGAGFLGGVSLGGSSCGDRRPVEVVSWWSRRGAGIFASVAWLRFSFLEVVVLGSSACLRLGSRAVLVSGTGGQ